MRGLTLTALWALLALPTAASFAASGGVVFLPGGPLPGSSPAPGRKPPKPSGLALAIDTSWLASNGYRPVRLTITPRGAPNVADRTLMVRLLPDPVARYYGSRSPSIAVTQQIDIPAQSPGLTVTISVPQDSAWGQLELEVFEDGELVEELSSKGVYPNAEGGFNGNSTVNNVTNMPNIGRSPAFLQIGGSDKQARDFIQQTFFSPWGWFCVDVTTQPNVTQQFNSPPWELAVEPQMASTANLPDHWIDFSGVDVFFISLPKLKEFVAQQPQQWLAVRAAGGAGGNLWVYDVGNQLERLSELERAIDLPAQPIAPAGTAQSDLAGRWVPPDPDLKAAEVYVNDSQLTPAAANGASIDPPFVTRPLGCGQVVAIGAPSPTFAGFNRNWLLNSVGTKRLVWAERHGAILGSERGDNVADFWQFLIPGVGLTPVVQFQILITLFVIAIGPVNYFLLRRWRRLNLLLITVPASAAFVTLVLFGYALIHDGLGVRVRVRSFTQLDLRRGEAVCWSRLSYYAGMSPSRGLTFPGDVAVYPFEAEPETYRRSDLPPKEMNWQPADDKSPGAMPMQHFSSDWLPARTPKQFITVRSRKTPARLSITQPQQGGPLQIENHLGTRIIAMAISDAKNTQFGAEGIANGQSVSLTSANIRDAMATIRETLTSNALESPLGGQTIMPRRSPYGSSYYPQAQYSPPMLGPTGTRFQILNSGPAPQHDGVLERNLQQWSQSLPPRGFVAIVERSPEVALGLDSVSEEASLHVIAGEW